MEIFCVMAALAALFLGSAALTLKARVPAGLAPLVTLSCIVAVLTLAGMAGVLYPAAWAVYALCAAGGVWALLPPKEGKKRYYAQLATPGSVTFWALALAFAVYFFVRQPMATVSDEFSLWATAVKVTKVDNSLYSTASLGTPWAVTQNPGLPLLSYFFQFFGRYADWKIYLAYDVLFFAVYAAVLSVLPVLPLCVRRGDHRAKAGHGGQGRAAASGPGISPAAGAHPRYDRPHRGAAHRV